MIVTVTPNTAIDRTFFIDRFIWNKTIHSSQSVIGMGGKGTDAAWILGELGYGQKFIVSQPFPQVSFGKLL